MFDKSVIATRCALSRDASESAGLCAIPRGQELNIKPLGVDLAMAWIGKYYIGIVSMSRLA